VRGVDAQQENKKRGTKLLGFTSLLEYLPQHSYTVGPRDARKIGSGILRTGWTSAKK